MCLIPTGQEQLVHYVSPKLLDLYCYCLSGPDVSVSELFYTDMVSFGGGGKLG